MRKKYLLSLLFLVCCLLNRSQQSYLMPLNGTLTINGPDTVCAGASGSLTLSGHTGSIDHWEISTNGGSTWNNGVGTSVNQTFFMIPQTTCYRVILNAGADTSTTICVIVDQPSNPGTVSGGGNFCATTGPGTLTVSGNNGLPVGWDSSPNGTTWTATGNNTTSQSYGVITTDTYYRFCTKNGVCPLACDSILLDIDAPSDAGSITSPFSVCSTGNSGSVTTTAVTGNVIGWGTSTNGGSTWSVNTGNTSLSESYSNLSVTTDYCVIVQNGVCPADTAFTTATVDVPGVGGAISGGTFFCGSAGSGTLTLGGYTGNISGWQYSTNGGATWTPISNTTSSYAFSGVTQTTIYQAIIGTGGCPVVYSTADTVFYYPNANAGTLSSSASVCAGYNSGTLNMIGASGASYVWLMSTNGGATWTNLGNNSTSYSYTNVFVQTEYVAIAVSGICGVDTSNVVTLSIIPVTPVNAGPDLTINQGSTAQLNATGGSGTILWLPGSTLSSSSILNPVASPSVTTTYTITVQDVNGCFAVDSVVVNVTLGSFTGVIANTLTPDGDGVNDAWYVENALSYTDTDVKIFNEYGMEIYSAAPYKNDWKGTYNGNKLPDGTYYYVLTFKNSSLTVKGTINLISN